VNNLYKKSYKVRRRSPSGAAGLQLEKGEDLRTCLGKCLSTPGAHVIDVPVDYSENQKVLIDELQDKTCAL
jgi:acetolactate synthase-1/2/3 large subunit